MYIVTTLDYDQLALLIGQKSVSLDNDNLIFGQSFDSVRNYILDKLGTPGYVVGIKGRINNASAKLLASLDKDLKGDKLILEAQVDESEIIRFNVKGIEEALEILTYGLPDEMLYEQLDSSLTTSDEKGIQIICTPVLKDQGNIRITSLGREVGIEAEGITFVKLKK